MRGYDTNRIESLTRITRSGRKALVQWYEKQYEQTRIEAFHLFLKALKGGKPPSDQDVEAAYGVFMEVLRLMKGVESRDVDRKLSPEKVAIRGKIREHRMKGRYTGKSAPKFSKVLELYQEFRRLRREGWSWREIADFSPKKFRLGGKPFVISHTHLMLMYKQVAFERGLDVDEDATKDGGDE